MFLEAKTCIIFFERSDLVYGDLLTMSAIEKALAFIKQNLK